MAFFWMNIYLQSHALPSYFSRSLRTQTYFRRSLLSGKKRQAEIRLRSQATLLAPPNLQGKSPGIEVANSRTLVAWRWDLQQLSARVAALQLFMAAQGYARVLDSANT